MWTGLYLAAVCPFCGGGAIGALLYVGSFGHRGGEQAVDNCGRHRQQSVVVIGALIP